VTEFEREKERQRRKEKEREKKKERERERKRDKPYRRRPLAAAIHSSRSSTRRRQAGDHSVVRTRHTPASSSALTPTNRRLSRARRKIQHITSASTFQLCAKRGDFGILLRQQSGELGTVAALYTLASCCCRHECRGLCILRLLHLLLQLLRTHSPHSLFRHTRTHTRTHTLSRRRSLS